MDNLTYTQILDVLPNATQPQDVGLETAKDMQSIYAAGLLLRYRDSNSAMMNGVIRLAQDGDPFCYKVISFVIEFFLAKEIPLTDALHRFNDDVITGKARPRSGKSKNTDFIRNLIIADAVGLLMSEGVSENSATLIVSKEMEKRGYTGLGHESIRQIMKNIRKSH